MHWVLLDFFPSPTEELATGKVIPTSAFESTQVQPCSPCFANAGCQVSAGGVQWWICYILAQETTILLEKCLNLDCKMCTAWICLCYLAGWLPPETPGTCIAEEEMLLLPKFVIPKLSAWYKPRTCWGMRWITRNVQKELEVCDAKLS